LLGLREREDQLGRVDGDRSAALDDDRAHVRYSALMRT
jgi:hypothetical protein